MIYRKVCKLEDGMKYLAKEVKAMKSSKSAVKEELVESHSGKKINVNRIPAKDEYQYGLRLLDVLFSKEEMVDHLMLKSKRSDKPALDKTKVDIMLGLIDKRFGTT